MMPVPKNELQKQFEYEKSLLEKYGHVSSLTFEEWLKIKETAEHASENNKLQFSPL